jgi:hypothetical protein
MGLPSRLVVPETSFSNAFGLNPLDNGQSIIGTLTDSVLMTIISKLVNYMLSMHHEALYKRKIFFADYA